MPYLPNWLHGLVPEAWWPEPPRDYYKYTLNVLPLAANGSFVKALVLSKTADSLVWGGTALITDVNDTFLVEPSSGNPPNKMIRLSNPPGQEAYTNGFVPIENILATPGGGATQATRTLPGGVAQAAAFAGLWPIPLQVMRGGELLVELANMTATAHNLRLTFWVALVDTLARKAA